MSRYASIVLAAMASLMASVLLLAPSAGADDVKAGDLTISGAWARANVPGRPAAAYLHIANVGAADRLVSASSSRHGRVELHDHIVDGDVMKMVEIEGIDVPSERTVSLAPGGRHVMLFDAQPAMNEGDVFDLILTFEQAGDVAISVTAMALGSRGPSGDAKAGHDHSGHEHGHDDHGHDDHGHDDHGHDEDSHSKEGAHTH